MLVCVVCLDFKAERNVLLRDSFPVLQQYCAELGLDFQVVDLRWGVTDEVINDHQVSAVCLSEIASCQRVSVGPNFVVCMFLRLSLVSALSSIVSPVHVVLITVYFMNWSVCVKLEILLCICFLWMTHLQHISKLSMILET